MGVSLRTVYRDIERLREEGYVVEGISGPGGGFWLAEGCAPAPLSLGLDEVREVLFALHGSGSLDTDLGERLLGALPAVGPSDGKLWRCTHELSRAGSCSRSTTPPSPFKVDIVGAGRLAWSVDPKAGVWSSSSSETHSGPTWSSRSIVSSSPRCTTGDGLHSRRGCEGSRRGTCHVKLAGSYSNFSTAPPVQRGYPQADRRRCKPMVCRRQAPPVRRGRERNRRNRVRPTFEVPSGPSGGSTRRRRISTGRGSSRRCPHRYRCPHGRRHLRRRPRWASPARCSRCRW